MAYWLLKSEPGSWSWDDQVRDSVTEWDGVRNHQANNNMKAMKEGDRCFFYHSVNAKEIVGVVEVVKEHYPDPTDSSGRFGMVDVKAVVPVGQPVTLKQIKEDSSLERHGASASVAAFGEPGVRGGVAAHLHAGRHRGLSFPDAALRRAPCGPPARREAAPASRSPQARHRRPCSRAPRR